jgi:hypothetical protein
MVSGRRAWLSAAMVLMLAPGNAGATPRVAVAADGTAATDLQLEAQIARGRLDGAVLARLLRHGQADAIISFTPPDEQRPTDRAVIARWKVEALEPLSRAGGILRDYGSLRSTFVRFTSDEQLLATLRNPAVEGIGDNRAVWPADIEANRLIRQPQAAAAGYRGAGASLAVLDTGVDYRRRALGSCTAPGKPDSCRVVVARDFAPQDHSRDAVGHGTAVAEVVAAVAPGAKILALDVFRSNGLAYDSDLLAAFDWLLEHRATWNVRAINLSVADATHWVVACSLGGLAPAFEAAASAGMVVSVASGNGAELASAYVDGVAYPACVPGALSVGGVYDADIGQAKYGGCTDAVTGPDRIPCFSQGGTLLGVLAPAASIGAGGLEWRGTSLAVPHVAASVAVLAASVPRAMAARIRYVLRTSGRRILDPRNGSHRDRLNLYAAVKLIRDRFRPTLSGQAPKPGAVGVAPSTAVIASFSEAVSGVGRRSMTLRDAQGLEIPANVTYDAAHRRATLRPTVMLLPAATYTVTLSSDIRDAAGNRLRTTSWSFTTSP